MDSGESTDTEAAGERAKAAHERAEAERRRSKPGLTSVGHGGWSYDSDDSMECEWLWSKVPEHRLRAAIDKRSVAEDSTTCQAAAKFEPTCEWTVPEDLPKYVNYLIHRGIANNGTPC